ncbi:uncharacterized protein LOC135960487 [Calliphora vicina]|uniref:uncharacterized protein LOC135960487 n=1 Tax=Calliphora vicina TaxID=7373 RepID=UPI00325AB503
MADELSKLGFSYSSRDVHVKLQNFTQRYRKEKAAMGASAGSPSTWSQYGRVHQIIGGFKANLFSELKSESINDSSTSSSFPLNELSSSLPPVSPASDEAGTTASSAEPAKKRKLENFEKLSTDISEHRNKSNKLKRKRLAWSKASEEVLLDLWPSRLGELREQRKKGHIYAEMADELSKLGFSFSSRDVHVKLQNFTQRYRKEKAVTGGLPSTWSQYGRVHQIIGGLKTNLFTELKFESIDDSSTSSSSLPSPCTPLTEPSSPLQPVSSAPGEIGTPASSTEHTKKKRKLENFEKLSTAISEHLKKCEANERELIAIEKKKADSLDCIAKALISFLNKK